MDIPVSFIDQPPAVLALISSPWTKPEVLQDWMAQYPTADERRAAWLPWFEAPIPEWAGVRLDAEAIDLRWRIARAWVDADPTMVYDQACFAAIWMHPDLARADPPPLTGVTALQDALAVLSAPLRHVRCRTEGWDEQLLAWADGAFPRTLPGQRQYERSAIDEILADVVSRRDTTLTPACWQGVALRGLCPDPSVRARTARAQSKPKARSWVTANWWDARACAFLAPGTTGEDVAIALTEWVRWPEDWIDTHRERSWWRARATGTSLVPRWRGEDWATLVTAHPGVALALAHLAPDERPGLTAETLVALCSAPDPAVRAAGIVLGAARSTPVVPETVADPPATRRR